MQSGHDMRQLPTKLFWKASGGLWFFAGRRYWNVDQARAFANPRIEAPRYGSSISVSP